MISEILTITALITTIFTIFTILAALYGKYIFDRITGDAFDLSFIGYVRSIIALLVMLFILISCAAVTVLMFHYMGWI